MNDYNPDYTVQKKSSGNTALIIISVLLLIALVVTCVFFSARISSLEQTVNDYKNNGEAQPATTGNDSETIKTMESTITRLSQRLEEANETISTLRSSSMEGLSEEGLIIESSENVKNSIVCIRVTIPAQRVQSWWSTYTTPEQSAEGTGIIISADGYIATNEHVITYIKSYENAYIEVIMPDDTVYSATLVGSDKTTDLAVIKIEAVGLTPIKIGSSESLKVGQTVLAIGNPLGSSFAGSVTKGIVSALDRKVSTENSAPLMIQHDAAINPGNSGGALVNIYGELMGINSSKISSTDVEGLGFAIPIDYAMPLIDDMINYGYVRGRVTIGFDGQTLSSLYALRNGLPEGLIVTNVVSNSGADLAGIKQYDVIVEMDGKAVTSMTDVENIKTEHSVGDIITVKYYRSGSYRTVNVLLMEDTSSD